MFRRFLHRLQYKDIRLLTSRDAYRKWAQSYPPTPHNRLMEIEQEAMLRLMPKLKGQRVLDLACGTGRYGLLALDQNAQMVFAIDDSHAMVSQADLENRALGSMEAIPFADASIDCVICGLAVGHSRELSVILEEIARVLDKHGYAIISDFHPFQHLSGARRTFKDETAHYEVEHYPHLYQVWHNACCLAGLQIDAIVEPTITKQGMPVVIVYRLKKT